MSVIQQIYDEVTGDPMGLGFSWAMDDDAIVALANDEALRSRARTSMTQSEFLQTIDPVELRSLCDGSKLIPYGHTDPARAGANVTLYSVSPGHAQEETDLGIILLIMGMNEINPSGTEGELVDLIFGPQSATALALDAKQIELISRAQELNMAAWKPGWVAEARKGHG